MDRKHGRKDVPRKSDEDRFDESCSRYFGKDYHRYFLNPGNIAYDNYIEKLKEFIKNKANSISPSQLRNIFALIKRQKDMMGMKKLRPKLAYTYGRAEKNASLKELLFFMDSQIKGLSDQSEVESLIELFEAIVAYHKYYREGEQ